MNTDEGYDWADDAELTSADLLARLRGLPAARVFTSREAYLRASDSPFHVVGPSANTGSGPARVLPTTTAPAGGELLVSPAG